MVGWRTNFVIWGSGFHFYLPLPDPRVSPVLCLWGGEKEGDLEVESLTSGQWLKSIMLLSAGGILDRCSCQWTKSSFYHRHGQCEVFTYLGRTKGERARPRNMVKPLNFSMCIIRLFPCSVPVGRGSLSSLWINAGRSTEQDSEHHQDREFLEMDCQIASKAKLPECLWCWVYSGIWETWL